MLLTITHSCSHAERESERFALLIIYRWVFGIGKGESEEVMNSMYCGWVLQKSLCLQAYCICCWIPGWEKEDVPPSHIPFLSSYLTDYTGASDCLISCWVCRPVSLSVHVFVSAWQDLVICCLSGSRLVSDHARLQESTRLLHFNMTHASMQ